MLRLFAALMATAVAMPAFAQTSRPAPADPAANLVEELVVNARTPGPAWWRVSKGDAVVFVMGIPGIGPSDVTYDDTLLKRRLEGANRLILAPKPSFSMFSMIRLLATIKHFPPPKPLRQLLPPEQAKRVEAVLAARGDALDDVDDVRPALAGFELSSGGGKGKGVSMHMGEVGEDIEKLARSPAIHAKPRIVSTGKVDVLGQIMALNDLPMDQQLVCLDDGVRAAESGKGGAEAVSLAWAQGRVRDVVDADRGFEACLSRSPAGARDVRRRTQVSVRAIQDALKAPGLSVALVELRPLLAEGGVLDQLRQAGYEVRSPGG